MNNITTEMRGQACLALDFLNNHPSMTQISSSYMNECAFWMVGRCKRGLANQDVISVSTIDPRFNEFKHKLEPNDDFVYVSYYEFYGEPWELDHVEYGLSTTFFVYEKDIPPSVKTHVDWMRYEGFRKFGSSFEEIIIATAIEVSEIFGSFDRESFLTEEERNNHANSSAFFESEIPGDLENMQLNSNPSYLWVSDEEINRRWLKWFVKTDWCKKHWGDQFTELASKSLIDVKPVPIKLKLTKVIT